MGIPEDRLQLRFENLQRPGNTELAGIRLAGDPATMDTDDDVDRLPLSGVVQGRHDGVLMLQDREICFQPSAINRDLARTGTDADARHRCLAAACSQGIVSWIDDGLFAHNYFALNRVKRRLISVESFAGRIAYLTASSLS